MPKNRCFSTVSTHRPGLSPGAAIGSQASRSGGGPAHGFSPTRFPTLLTSVYRWPPAFVNCADVLGVAAGETDPDGGE
jgi:hypothetical protein